MANYDHNPRANRVCILLIVSFVSHVYVSAGHVHPLGNERITSSMEIARGYRSSPSYADRLLAINQSVSRHQIKSIVPDAIWLGANRARFLARFSSDRSRRRDDASRLELELEPEERGLRAATRSRQWGIRCFFLRGVVSAATTG